MTTGPADERAAPPDHLRASHLDREHMISALKTAFVQGRLVKDEFDSRVGQALASRTHAELAAITADIPIAPIGGNAEAARPGLGVKSGLGVTVGGGSGRGHPVGRRLVRRQCRGGSGGARGFRRRHLHPVRDRIPDARVAAS